MEVKKLDMLFAKALASCRENKGYTQLELAEKIGVAQPTIAKLEKGYSSPSAAILTNLADALEVSTDYLLGRTK